ncbi:T9SS type A sorting domain-containing protein [Flavobacteriaceae bacterium LMO-SS05]
MKKTTHKNLSKRLVKYGALSVALAGLTDVNGQIVYTDPPDSGGSDYLIDLNGDFNDDFKIIYKSSVNALGIQAIGSYNAVLGSESNSFQYPFALSNNAIISSAQTTWINGSFQLMNQNSCAFPISNKQWCDVTDKYLGLKLFVDGGPGSANDKTYYGWARLNVPKDASGWMIKDFAYNSTPDELITAGQTVLDIDDNVFSKIKVVALNKSIGLYNLPEATKYNVYNMTGLVVLKGSTENRDHVIETPTLASGVYVLELTDTNSKGVIRKKVVLQ